MLFLPAVSISQIHRNVPDYTNLLFMCESISSFSYLGTFKPLILFRRTVILKIFNGHSLKQCRQVQTKMHFIYNQHIMDVGFSFNTHHLLTHIHHRSNGYRQISIFVLLSSWILAMCWTRLHFLFWLTSLPIFC